MMRTVIWAACLLFAACTQKGIDDGTSSRSLHLLGQALFFDAELSGNRNISCGSCHVPFLSATETLPLSIGEGGEGIGPLRAAGEEGIVLPRNTPSIFNRMDPAATALFWDGRLELVDGEVEAPVEMPEDIDTLLEAQALLPLLERNEMRGHVGDIASDEQPNELAAIDDAASMDIWDAILDRVLSFHEYRILFFEAFPEITSVRVSHLAKALAAFETRLWDVFDSRFDEFFTASPEAVAQSNLIYMDDDVVPRFVFDERFASDDELHNSELMEALETSFTESEIRGARLFVGDAGCVRCHSGPLLSDMRYHNIGVPHLGPGRNDAGRDEGRFEVTGDPRDRFAFRTAPLHNARITGPFMHNGAFATLEDAVRHHLDPEGSLRSFDGSHLPAAVQATIQADQGIVSAIVETLDANTAPHRPLTDREVGELVAFLSTLDSTSELDRESTSGVPDRVPSGLPVDRWAAGPHPSR